MLINRLTDHVVGKNEMSSTQVRSAEVLLRKSLPDLRATELTGVDGGPIVIEPKPIGFETPEED